MKKFLKTQMDRITKPEKNYEKEMSRAIKKLKRLDENHIDDLDEKLENLVDEHEAMIHDVNYSLEQILVKEEDIMILTEKLNMAKELLTKRYE